MPSDDLLSVSYEKQVPFYDVDAYRIVWHGHYPKYFEVGRCQLLEDIGYSYKKMEESGYFFPIIDMRVKYVESIEFEQRIKVQSSLKLWENKLTIDYRIFDIESGRVLTKAQTSQIAVKMPEKITQFETPKPIVDVINAWVAQRR